MSPRRKKSDLTDEVVIKNNYFFVVRRPLYSLCFLLPLIALYEIGTIIVDAEQIANAPERITSFTWIIGIARVLGVGGKLVWAFPGAMVVITMLCMHIFSNFPWKVRLSWLFWMGFESFILTVPLFVICFIMNGTSFSEIDTGSSYYAKLVTGVGAGIYEELVFRLIILGLLLLLLDDILRFDTTVSVLLATMISAFLFAAHHYYGIDMSGGFIRLEEIHAGDFLFRMAAGIYFALVFHYRGYGIVVGAHACYDIIYFTMPYILKLF